MLTRVIRFGADALAGVPSIIFGLFGFILFVIRLRMGWSLAAGGLTLAFMILPTIIRTTEEAIRTVPQALREVSLSLGATKWQTVTRVVVPNALPGVPDRHPLERGPQHRRDRGRHLHRRLNPDDAQVPARARPDSGRAFLHPGPRRPLDGTRLRHRRSS